MTPRWPVVIFDLDGTLVNSIDLIVASYQHAFRTVLGHEHDEAEIKTWIGQSLYGSMKKHFPDDADAIYREYTTWNEAHTPELLTDYPGIPELLKDLVTAGVRIGIVTSKRVEPGQWLLDLAHLDQLISLVVTHNDTTEHKPDPAPLLLAVERLGAQASQAAYVGDAAVDVLSAHNAGLDAVGVTWGAGTRSDLVAAGPMYLCDRVDDLHAVLLPTD